MSQLKLFFLGPPRIEIDGVPIELKRRKALALLAYLTVVDEPQRRDTLASLLMPDSPQSSARAALRRDLASLNQSLGKVWFDTRRETIGLNDDQKIWVDIHQFRRHFANCQKHPDSCLKNLSAAVTLYRDDFLAGFTLPNCPDFDDWQFFQTEDLRQLLANILEQLVYRLSANKDYETAISYARRWISLDQLYEPAHQQLMILHALAGHTSAALRQYQFLVEILDEEMGTLPSTETEDLYARIRASEFYVDEERQTGSLVTVSSDPIEAESAFQIQQHSLPTQATPFVGRSVSVANAVQSLRDPACRLLTLIGPGGIGKTRLAIQAAQIMIEQPEGGSQFAHGVFYVPLTAVSSAGGIIAAMANALRFSFYTHVPPEQQLLDYLREKQLLLILDNFEHLISEIALLTDILAVAPQVKLLVTSRELLNLHEEWHQAVTGLRYPVEDELLTDPESYSAIQLFVQSARRAQPSFVLAEEQESVRQICQLVEGMPLAIELAAAWLKMFPCAHIATEIENNLNFLATNLRNVPERHRSVWAVFEYSWQLLPEIERSILMQLAVFQGGFRQEAAERIIGASLMTLATLVEKSMLYTTSTHRYQLHELMRQFITEKWEAQPEIEAKTRNRHSDYYLTYLGQHEAELGGIAQKYLLEEMQLEIRNIQAAWFYAVAQAKVALLGQATESLYFLYKTWSRFQKGAELFQVAVARLQAIEAAPSNRILGKLMARQGAFNVSLGRHTTAIELLEASLNISRKLEQPTEIAFALNFLGVIAATQGDHLQAKTNFAESLQISQAHQDQSGVAYSLLRLGEVTEYLGQYQETEAVWQESLSVNRALNNYDAIAYSLDKLATIAFTLGHYPQAKQYHQESLEIFRELGDARGEAIALSGLALAALGAGDKNELALAEQGVRICRNIGHRLELVLRLIVLGLVLQGLNDHEKAAECYLEALDISQILNFPRGLAWSYICLGDASRAGGEYRFAIIYLHQGLELGLAGQFIPATLAGVLHYAKVFISEGSLLETEQNPKALSKIMPLLQLVANHPASWQMYKDQATDYLMKLAKKAVAPTAKNEGLEVVVADILNQQILALRAFDDNDQTES